MRSTWNRYLAPLRDNRGSGVVLVLVSMLFVSMLGATVLYMSYTGFQMKVTERQGKQTFYDAAAAMSEVEAGVQQVVTDSIASAYNTVLVHYSDPTYLSASGSATMTEKFQSVFRGNVSGWSVGGKALISGSAVSADVLKSFLSTPAAVTVSAGNAVFEPGIAAGDGGRIVLKNVVVSLNRQPTGTEYTSRVGADLVIDMPDFYYLTSEYSITGIPQFAVIAKNSLTQAIGASLLSIDGSAYAGAVTLSGTGSTFTISNGVMICAKDLSVTDGGGGGKPRLTVEPTVSLWSGGITLNAAGTAALGGTTYVADDLALEGTGAGATLSGTYFGFGDSTTSSAESSAILVNGRGTALNLTGLNRLILAGHAFVGDSFFPSQTVVGAEVMMGESLAVKSNQLAYLIPAENLVGTTLNPLVTGNAPTVTLNATLPILGTKLPAEYGMSLKRVELPRGSSSIYYYFMQFATPAGANQFYADYFALHREPISANLALYTTLTGAPGVAQTAGYTVRPSGGSYSLLAPAANTDYLTSTSAQLKGMFHNLCRTLTPTTTAGVTDPYQYIVKESAVNALASGVTEFKNTEGEMVALIARGDYVIGTSTPDTVRLVLATGNVTVSRNFEGLIVSGNTISINDAQVRTVKADEANVVRAFAAKNTAGAEFRSFLNIDVGATVEGTTGGSGSWSLDRLVTLRNWTKD